MGDLYYQIDYENMLEFSTYINEKMIEWIASLDEIQAEYNLFVESDSFQGKGIESAKTYLKDSHDITIASMKAVLDEYRSKLDLYRRGFYLSDGSTTANLPEEVFERVNEKFSSISGDLESIHEGVGLDLSKIDDLITFTNPSIGNLSENISGIKNDITNLNSDVAAYEDKEKEVVEGNLATMIESLNLVVDEYLNNEHDVTSYSEADVYGNKYLPNLLGCIEQSSQEAIDDNELLSLLSDDELEALNKIIEAREEYESYLIKQESGVYYDYYLENYTTHAGRPACAMFGRDVYASYYEDYKKSSTLTELYNELLPIELEELGLEIDVCDKRASEMTIEEYVNFMGPVWELCENHRTSADFFEELKLAITVLSIGLAVLGVGVPALLGVAMLADPVLDIADVAVSAITGDQAGVVIGIVSVALPEVFEGVLKGGKAIVKNSDNILEGMDDVRKADFLKLLDEQGIKDVTKINVDNDTLRIYTKSGIFEIDNVKDWIEGASNLDEVFSLTKNFDEARAAIAKVDIPNLNSTDLNKLLTNAGSIADLSDDHIALLKSDIIKEAGFTNFNWKGVGEEVKAFTNMNVNVVELDEPLVLYRRGNLNEPDGTYGLGKWWGDKYRTIDEVRDELAVLEEWGNPLTGEYKIVVPKGTKLLTGTAAPQKHLDELGNLVETRAGGGVQFWLDDIPKEWLTN